MFKNIFLTLCVAVFFAGCSDVTKSEIEDLRKSISDIKADAELDKILNQSESIAYLTPGDSGYSVIRCDIGAFTVQWVDVKPYANGSKITLKFGNPLSAAIDGLKGKIDWGKSDSKGGPDNSNAKTKDFQLTQTMISGAWTSTSIVLDAIPPAELGFVRIHDLRHSGISLRGGY